MAPQAGMTLDALVKQITDVHGPLLRCVVLYGSAASGEAVAGQSDLNVLVLVDRVERERMQQLAATIRAWNEAGNLAPLTLTHAEWLRSADIFPIEYADILERHRILAGTATLEGVRVEAHDLRLQLEREAMALLLRLRSGVMMAGSDARAQATLLTDSLSALMVVFRAVMRLNGTVPPREYVAVARAVAAFAAFDAGPFERVIAMARDRKQAAPADTPAVLDAYVAGVETLVAHLDRFTATRAS